MKKIIFTILTLFIFLWSCNNQQQNKQAISGQDRISNQFLDLDELLGFMSKKPTTITELLVSKNWKLSSSEKNESEDKSLLLNQNITWCYNCKQDNKADVWLYYSKELNTDINKGRGHLTTLKLSFESTEYYKKIKKDIDIKNWRLMQDEVSSNMVFKTWNQGKYSIVLTIETVNNRQSFSLWFNTIKAEW
jgi:hypothetical protein